MGSGLALRQLSGSVKRRVPGIRAVGDTIRACFVPAKGDRQILTHPQVTLSIFAVAEKARFEWSL